MIEVLNEMERAAAGLIPLAYGETQGFMSGKEAAVVQALEDHRGTMATQKPCFRVVLASDAASGRDLPQRPDGVKPAVDHRALDPRPQASLHALGLSDPSLWAAYGPRSAEIPA